MISIFSTDLNIWFVVPFIAFIERDPRVESVDEEYANTLYHNAPSLYDKRSVITPFYPLPLITNLTLYLEIKKTQGPDVFTKNVLRDLMDEVNAARHFAVCYSCSNVEAEEITVSNNLNKKREKKGKQKLYNFHILTISMNPGKYQDNSISESFGKRNAPRQHLRRGHVRRLENKITWVNSTIVGKGDFVNKDYRLD